MYVDCGLRLAVDLFDFEGSQRIIVLEKRCCVIPAVWHARPLSTYLAGYNRVVRNRLSTCEHMPCSGTLVGMAVHVVIAAQVCVASLQSTRRYRGGCINDPSSPHWCRLP